MSYEYKYPNMAKSKVICVDIETHDPHLREKGNGVYRRDGKILGVSLANDRGDYEYYNIGHVDCTPAERETNIKYLRDVLSNPVPKLGANLLYDLDWLENFEGLKVNGTLHDVQVAEPLIDEYAKSYSLDNLGKKYLQHGKTKNTIDNWCMENGFTGDARIHLHRMPSWIVREYAEDDAKMPIEIFKRQYKVMESEGLLDVYNMEMSLYPMLLQMRKQGVRIDTLGVENAKKMLKDAVNTAQNNIIEKVGILPNLNSSPQLAELFDRLGISYPRTEKGAPSIRAEYMQTLDHPVIADILLVRKYQKADSTFFENSFTGHAVNGRIHCAFNPLRSDEYGTVSGRFSSSNPNLQQIPSRDKIIGPLCRSVFIPEEGHLWGKIDWSQIEYRLIAHYAQGNGADNIRKRYNDNPKTDYHQEIMDLTGLERKLAKNLNFGLGYGMGPDKASAFFGWGLDYAREIFATYHEKVPFVKHTLNLVGDTAKKRGYVKTLLGRRARLQDKNFSYKMFNRLVQGSAADLMKKAMVDAYQAGIFNILKPHLTVHDELDFSIPQTKEGTDATNELKHIMETCVPLSVPILAELEIGTNWATVKK
jgi:DNA polymerase I-like protein with 3'-5' exonuclease and polymerase domains